MAEQPPPKRPFWRDSGRIAGALAIAFGVVCVVAAIGYQVLKRPADVHRGAEVTFKPQKPKKPKVRLSNWPIFGLDRARTRYLPAQGVKPPFRKMWSYGARPLLEFPPIYANGTLYFVDNNGRAFALDAKTGHILWKRDIASLNASAPAYARGRLYIANLVPGQLLKLDAKTGKTLWRRPLPNRSESSPLVVGSSVYFGDEDGNLYSVSTRNGHVRWSTALAGPVKSAPAYDKGVLFVGDYGGEMSAVHAATGKIKWQGSSQGLSFARTGQFYSTPAVGFGRVYAGNNDGRVYSFDEKTGTLAWTHSTGSYVYSGGVLAKTPNTAPTFYIGSYDGNLYALNAKTGDSRWTQPLGGPVIGGATAVGQIVYIATFSGTTTYGFSMKDGRKLFTYSTGAYTPVISDGQWIFLTGYSSITALKPYTKGAGKHGRRHRAALQKQKTQQQQKQQQQAQKKKRAQAAKRKHRASPPKQGGNKQGSKQGNKQAKGAPAHAQQQP